MEEPIVEIKEINLNVIYVRYQGTYLGFRKQSMSMVKQLFAYAKKHHIPINEENKVMTLYHDNPYITQEHQLRTSVALSVPNDFNYMNDDRVGSLEIQGKFAILHFHINRNEYDEAWKYAYFEYLFKSHEKPRDSFPIEMYLSQPPKNTKDKSFTDILIPIE